MRKRSKYRPKKVLVNPVGYVLEGMTPLAKHEDSLVRLQLKHHYAMAALTQGKATRDDMDRLINMANMTEALFRLGFGADYADVIAQGMPALLHVCRRGAESGKFILKSEEMRAINTLVELHDAQLEIATVQDIDRGVALVEREHKHKRVDSIIKRT
jgi:hypothetical protein